MNFPQRTLQQILKSMEGRSVLDIGSAGQGNPEHAGQWLFGLLAGKARSIKGIDLAPSTDPRIVQASAEDFELGRQFEIITMFDVIEHLDNVGLALHRIRRHLQPGGKLILTTPNLGSIGPVLDIIFFRGIRSNPTHTLGYNRRMLRHMLEKQGFEIITLELVWFPMFGNHRGIKKLLSVLRCILAYPVFLIWKEFAPVLYAEAAPSVKESAVREAIQKNTP